MRLEKLFALCCFIIITGSLKLMDADSSSGWENIDPMAEIKDTKESKEADKEKQEVTKINSISRFIYRSELAQKSDSIPWNVLEKYASQWSSEDFFEIERRFFTFFRIFNFCHWIYVFPST